MTETSSTPTVNGQSEFIWYYHPDHLGSTGFVTDQNGELYEHVEYFPFGETWVQEHSNTQRTPYLYTGKELDEETGLYYYGARYYDPRTSVWASADPILGKYLPSKGKGGEQLSGEGGIYNSANLAMYSYVHNKPVKYVDPNGEEITVKVQGTNVEITMTVQVSGPKANAASAQLFKTSTEKEFSGKFGSYNVKTTVDVKVEGKADPSRQQIVMTDEKKASSAQVGGSKATMRLGEKPESQMKKEMPHEVGHLFGLKDEYQESKDPKTGARVTPPLPGKEDSLMATIKPDARISEEHIGTIIQKSQNGELNKGIRSPD